MRRKRNEIFVPPEFNTWDKFVVTRKHSTAIKIDTKALESINATSKPPYPQRDDFFFKESDKNMQG